MAKKENNKLESIEELETEEKETIEPQTEKKAEKTDNKVARKEMDQLRSDVDETSQELKTAVNELKKSIVDIRSAVSEIENPFNLLRAISSEKDVKKLNSERLPPGVKSLTIGKPEENAPPEEELKKKPKEKHLPLKKEKPVKPPPPELQLPSETKPKIKPQPQPQTQPGSRYLDWIWGLLDSGLSSDDVFQLANSYESMGYLPVNSNEYIHSLAVASEKARSNGLAKGQMLLNMYKAASISGIKIDSEDVEALISIAENKVKNSGKKPKKRTKKKSKRRKKKSKKKRSK